MELDAASRAQLRPTYLRLVLAEYREVVVVGSVDSGDILRCRRSSASAESTAAVAGRGTAAAAVWKPGRRMPDAIRLPPGRRQFSSECPGSVHTFIHSLCAPIVPRGTGMRVFTLRSPGQRLLLDPVGELRDLVVDRPALGHQRADLLVRVHHGRVVAAAELLPDLGQREVRQLPAQVRRDL